MTAAFRVLRVDNESGLPGISRLFLPQSGDVSVETIGSASNALSLIQKEKFNATIYDYQVPGKEGITP
jgi:CheY-like chemotaxis protein